MKKHIEAMKNKFADNPNRNISYEGFLESFRPKGEEGTPSEILWKKVKDFYK